MTHSLFAAFRPLLPLMLAVFTGFFASGMALPVVPRHVHDTLGYGTVMVGLVMGAQYLGAILVGRSWAGTVADGRGPKVALHMGQLGIVATGAVYFASVALARPDTSLAVLLAGRLLTGVAEAFIITAALSWGMARVGPAHSGKVIGWIGMALFAAYAAAAPVGSWVHARWGFTGIAAATVLVPLLSLALVARVAGSAPGSTRRPSFWRVLARVQLPGLALTLSSFGYAAINAFVVLLYAQRGWGDAALAYTALGVGFIVARLLAGHLPDKLGGARVAAVCVALEAVGQVLLWAAGGPVVAGVGAALTGAGYALAFQGFGVEAVRRAPPESRGAAMGGYVAFQDLSMGAAGPLGGWLALHAGVDAVYLAGAVGAVGAGLLAVRMARA